MSQIATDEPKKPTHQTGIKSISRMPEKLQRRLANRLLSGNYASLDKLCLWLDGKGFKVTKSTLQRYKLSLAGHGTGHKATATRRKPVKLCTAALESKKAQLEAKIKAFAAQKKALEEMLKRRRRGTGQPGTSPNAET